MGAVRTGTALPAAVPAVTEWVPETHATSGVSVAELWVPTTEVARRAGRRRGPAEDLRAMIDGQAHAANKRINDTLGAQDTQPGSAPGDEGDDDSAQAS